MTIDKELLKILACPRCKGGVEQEEGGGGLVCNACRLVYPVRDGIPVMLVDEATELSG